MESHASIFMAFKSFLDTSETKLHNCIAHSRNLDMFRLNCEFSLGQKEKEEKKKETSRITKRTLLGALICIKNMLK